MKIPAVSLLLAQVLAAGSSTPATAQRPEPVEATLVGSIGLDERPIFDQIRGLAVLHGGGLVVSEPRLGQVRLVDPRTGSDSTIGGAGAGPGEFRRPMAVGQVDSMLWVWDPGLGRLTEFNPSLKVSRTTRVSSTGASLAVTTTGLIVGMSPGVDRMGRAALRLRVLDPDGATALDSIELGRGPSTLELTSGSIRNVTTQPWSDHALWVASPVGDGFLVVHRPTAGPPELELRRYGPEASLRWSSRLEYEPVPVTRAHVRAMAERIGAGTRGFAARRGIPIDPDRFSAAAIGRALDVPDRFPPVTAVAMGDAGEIYLRRSEMPNAGMVEYWILDPAGRVCCSLRLPTDFTLYRATGSDLWGTRVAADGRIYIARYRPTNQPTTPPTAAPTGW